MVNKFKLMIVLLAISQSGFAQDTMKIEPIEFDFPETPRIRFGPKDKYGPDTTKWPGWMQKGFDRSKGMVLDMIDTESLRINDTLKLILDTRRAFTIEKGDSSRGRKLKDFYYQDNLVFIEMGTTSEFLSLKAPVKDNRLKMSGIHKGKRIDLSSLTTLKQQLPNSYAWRDRIPNWVAFTFFAPNDALHLSVVGVRLSNNRDVLEMHYYDDRLVFISLGTKY